MTPAQIEQAFMAMMALSPEGLKLRRRAGMSRSYSTSMRCRMRAGRLPHLGTQARWVKRSGQDLGYAAAYTRADLLDFHRFACRQSASAQALGDAYLLDKWIARRTDKAVPPRL